MPARLDNNYHTVHKSQVYRAVIAIKSQQDKNDWSGLHTFSRVVSNYKKFEASPLLFRITM